MRPVHSVPVRVSVLAVLIGAAFGPPEGRGQSVTTVGPERVVSAADPGTHHIEPHLVVAAGALVVAAMRFDADGTHLAVAIYTSEDGGVAWTPAEGPDLRGADPWLAALRGRVVLTTLPDRVAASDDRGRSWTTLPDLPAGERPYDYTKLVADPVRGLLYATTSDGRPLVMVSRDGGDSFSGPVALEPNTINHTIGQPAVGTDGTLLVPFHEITVDGDYLSAPRLWLARSSDGGRSLEPPTLVSQEYQSDSPSLIVVGDRLHLGWTGLEVDGRHVVATSTDGGASWSEPVTLSGAAELGRITHHPVLAANARGDLLATWFEAVGSEPCYRLMSAASVDGGRTFGASRALGEPACNDHPGMARLGSRSLAARFDHGGDYHGLTALPDGGFVVAWADARSGVFQLRSRLLEVG